MNYTTEIYKVRNPSNSLRAYGSLVIEVNDTTKMKIKGFKIFEGRNGLFAKPPQSKGRNKEGEETWFDDIQFIDTSESNEFREEVYQTFVKEYTRANNTDARTNAASSQSNYSETNSKNNNKPLW